MTSNIRTIRFGILLAIAALIPLLSLNASKADTGLPTGNENTSVLAQNAGNAAATIAMDIYTHAGVLVGGASKINTGVAPGGSVNFPQASNNGLVPGFRGVGVLSADQPIFGLIARDILAAGSSNSKSYSLANASDEGGTTLALPIVFNELLTADWNSRVSVVNTGDSVACVRVTYFRVPGANGATPPGPDPAPVVDNGPGGSGCAQGHPVAAGGQVVFGRDAGLTRFPASTDNNQMAAEIEVLNANGNNNVTANVDTYRSDGNRLLGSYTALVDDGDSATDDVGTDIIIPIAMKSTSGFYTVIGVMNRGDATADVEIEYIGRMSDGTGSEVNQTVTLNDVNNVAFHSTYSGGTNVNFGFIGYARVTSSEPIAAIVTRGKQTSAGSGVNEAGYATVNGVSADLATEEWNLPLVFRRFAPGVSPSVGYNSWIQVQVADGSSANVTLRFVGDPASGCPTGPYQHTTAVDGSKVFYMNLNSDNGFPPGNSPSCFFGGAQVTADKPVVVIGQVGADKFPGGDSEGLYNAFGE